MRKAISHLLLQAALTVTIMLLLGAGIHAQQMADSNFKPEVPRPAYVRTHPKVVIDEAHSNFHTADGRYKPFAELLRSDGYQVSPGTGKFQKQALKAVSILVIANASAPGATDDLSEPAFTEQECDEVRDWVRRGGSLLLIADHTPFGSAAVNLAKRFGVEMGKGFVFDLANSDRGPTTLVYSEENGLLGDHPLVRGRDSLERVKRVVAFTGQSLSVPNGAVALMRLSSSAYESPTRSELQAALDMVSKDASTPKDKINTPHSSPVGGRAQGVAMKFGKGRVVILGEAAMFSAQVIRFKDGEQQQEIQMGMNVPGTDDKQFALNVLHWLSGLLK